MSDTEAAEKAARAAWDSAFPKDHDDPLGLRILPSPWEAFKAGLLAGVSTNPTEDTDPRRALSVAPVTKQGGQAK